MSYLFFILIPKRYVFILFLIGALVMSYLPYIYKLHFWKNSYISWIFCKKKAVHYLPIEWKLFSVGNCPSPNNLNYKLYIKTFLVCVLFSVQYYFLNKKSVIYIINTLITPNLCHLSFI